MMILVAKLQVEERIQYIQHVKSFCKILPKFFFHHNSTSIAPIIIFILQHFELQNQLARPSSNPANSQELFFH